LNILKSGNELDKYLKELIGSCSKTASFLLNKKNVSGLDVGIANYHGLQNLCADVIAELFIKDTSAEFPIRKALMGWDKEITDEASAYYFLSKLIGNRIEQEIAKKLKEADPFFGKILRSINHLVETNRVNKTAWFSVAYLIENDCDTITQKPLEPEFIESLPANLFIGSNEKIITNLFTYIKAETDFFPAIPLNALIRKIKFVNGLFLQQRNSGIQEEFFEEELNVERVVSLSLTVVYERLDKFYLNKGKLNPDETAVFKNVLIEISTDLKDGGISRGLFEYLHPHMLQLTKEEFYKKYHQTLDYLLRLLKKEIAERLDVSNN
jgi:hypothetical protein